MWTMWVDYAELCPWGWWWVVVCVCRGVFRFQFIIYCSALISSEKYPNMTKLSFLRVGGARCCGGRWGALDPDVESYYIIFSHNTYINFKSF